MWILTNCFIAVLFTSVTGGIVYGIWYLLKRKIAKWNPKLNYLFLRIICFFYTVPVVFAVIYVIRNYEAIPYGCYAFMFDYTRETNLWITVLSAIWGILTVAVLLHRIYQRRQLYGICIHNYPVREEEILDLFESVKKELHIKKKIRLVKNEEIASPMFVGVIRPTIIITDENFSEKELKMAITHELMHYRNRDIWLKWCAVFITVIHSYNPLSRLLMKEIDEWSEVNCDICTCKFGHFGLRTYYTFIVKQAENALNDKNKNYISYALFEENNEIQKRMNCMEYYKKRTRSKTVAALFVAGSIIVSGFTTSYAAGSLMADAYQKVYESTVVMVEEEAQEIPDGEEFFTAAEDDTCTQEIEEEVITLSANSTTKYIDWEVPAKTRKTTSQFKKSKDGTVKVVMESVDGKKIKVGIKDSDGNLSYVTTSSEISHTFKITKTGYYCVFVENMSTGTAEVSGLYR